MVDVGRELGREKVRSGEWGGGKTQGVENGSEDRVLEARWRLALRGTGSRWGFLLLCASGFTVSSLLTFQIYSLSSWTFNVLKRLCTQIFSPQASCICMYTLGPDKERGWAGWELGDQWPLSPVAAWCVCVCVGVGAGQGDNSQDAELQMCRWKMQVSSCSWWQLATSMPDCQGHLTQCFTL